MDTKTLPTRLALASMLLLSTVACNTHRTIPVENIREVTRTDTLYINNVQYDSIYINNVSYTDRSRDTLLIRETNTEYRYKLLRDTIERIKVEVSHDSIPYQVTVTEVKEVKRPPTWFDRLSRLCLVLVLAFIILLVLKPSRSLLSTLIVTIARKFIS